MSAAGQLECQRTGRQTYVWLLQVPKPLKPALPGGDLRVRERYRAYADGQVTVCGAREPHTRTMYVLLNMGYIIKGGLTRNKNPVF